MYEVSVCDISILVLYVIGTRVVLGAWLAWKSKKGGALQYFLAGRNLTWPVIGCSFYVSNMSGSTFVALPGSGYHNGIGVYNYEWLPALILVFFSFFMLPLFLKTNVFTAPEYLEKRYNRSLRQAFSGFLLLATIFIDAAAALYAGGTVLTILFPGISFHAIVWSVSLIAAVYILFGGLEAVVLNDTIQAFVIFIGGAVIAFMTLEAVPSWNFIRSIVPEEAFHLFRPATDPTMPWPGLVSGVLVIGIYFWCTNQFVMQRALGAKNLDHARWGSLFAGLLKLPNLFILILPGIMARHLYPALNHPDMVFPSLAFDLLPSPWRGLVLAALAAAILSSLEAIYTSAATLFTMDFVHVRFQSMSEASLVRTGRLATAIFMVLSALWAPQIREFPTLWQYLQSILSYITPPVVAVFLCGMFWKGATAKGAFFAFITCVPAGIAGWFFNEYANLTSIPYLYASGIIFVVSIFVIVVISLLAPDKVSGRKALPVWGREYWREDTVSLSGVLLWKNHRFLACLLVVLTLGIVVWWF